MQYTTYRSEANTKQNIYAETTEFINYYAKETDHLLYFIHYLYNAKYNIPLRTVEIKIRTPDKMIVLYWYINYYHFWHK